MDKKYGEYMGIGLMQAKSPILYRPGYAGLYIHFPYCIQKCEYCDFYSIGSGIEKVPEEQEIFDLYIQEIEERLRRYPRWLDYRYDTVFFGGGTPSRMELTPLEDLIKRLRKILPITMDAEVTLEANPEDISRNNLYAWDSMGINRINMGYQTTHKKHLEGVGRYYDEKVYQDAPGILSSSPISRYGFDLIYGFPKQTLDEFYYDLDFLLGYQPNHMSIYSLTMEKGTEYFKGVREGRRNSPEENLQEEIFRSLPGIMRERNLEWYEVSNYSISGNESRHNLKYWTYEPYLGIGPSASGFSGEFRYANPRSLKIYKAQPGQTREEPHEPIPELGLGILRLTIPVDWSGFLQIFSSSEQKRIRNLLQDWARRGYAEWYDSTKIFQWKEEAVLFLEDRIEEFSNIAEKRDSSVGNR